MSLFASPAGSGDKVLKGCLGFLPAASLQPAIWVHEQQVGPNECQEFGDTVLDFLLAGDTRRMNVVDTGPNLVRIAKLLESAEQLEVALRRLDRDDIRIKALDRWENIVEVRVAEVGVSLSLVRDTGGSESEGVNSPFEVVVPVDTAQRKL